MATAEAQSGAAPSAVLRTLEEAAQHPGFAELDLGVSIWVDGWGEVLAVNPELALEPASNQKILVAYGVNTLLESDARLRTTAEMVGSDLVVRAAADPTLTSNDISALAAELGSNGVAKADRLVVDVSNYAQGPRAAGWLDWQIPRYVGPLSGLMIDNNRWTSSDSFVTGPDLVNAERIRDLLSPHVAVTSVVVDDSPVGDVVAIHESEPIDSLVRTMLLSSDNQHADLLLMELGRVGAGDGTLSAGADVLTEQLEQMCIPIAGISDDGSGLSRDNQRSAREFQEILRSIRLTETGDQLREQLPVGGVSGTLASRFGGADAGRVQAKTGTIIGGRALSGYATTDSGREVVFSVIVNGEPGAAHASLGAIDSLVRAVLRT